MSGNSRRDPFSVRNERVRDNLTVVRKLRLPRNAQIRAQRTFAYVDASDPQRISMPFVGNLHLTLDSVPGTAGSILIENPFIRNANTRFVLNRQASPNASLVFVGPGLLSLENADANGLYVISVGQRNDRRNNGYSN